MTSFTMLCDIKPRKLDVRMRRVIRKMKSRGKEIVQWIREHTALTEDLGSVPSTHMTVHNHLQL